MAKASLLSRLKRVCYSARQQRSQGFTFLELLVVTVIGSALVAGLVAIVVELMGADQREASRNDTQRELQLAMDYISSELREAVFVYSGECLEGTTDTQCSRGGAVPLTNFLPPSLNNNRTVPVVAFWKQQPIPEVLRIQCATAIDNLPADFVNNTPCLTAHSYALVVYSITTDPAGGLWKGRARLTRYILTQFDRSGAPNPGWANPGVDFGTWPFGRGDSGLENRQTSVPTGSPAVLVDFVDDGRGAEEIEDTGGVPFTNVTCPSTNPGYDISPSDATLSRLGLTNLRTSFYACVGVGQSTTGAAILTLGVNQSVILFVLGNANGRPGIVKDNAFLPTLETRVLSRGVLERNPTPSNSTP